MKALFWKWWSLLHSHFNHHYLILPYTIHTYIRVRISMKSSWKKNYTRNHLPSIFKGEGRTWDIVVLDIRFLLQWSNNLPNIKIHQTNLQKEDWRRYLTAKNDNFPQEITYTYIFLTLLCWAVILAENAYNHQISYVSLCPQENFSYDFSPFIFLQYLQIFK